MLNLPRKNTLRIFLLSQDPLCLEAVNQLRRHKLTTNYELVVPEDPKQPFVSLLAARADVCICDWVEYTKINATLDNHNNPMVHLPAIIVLKTAETPIESRAYPLTESVALADASASLMHYVITSAIRHNHTLHALRTAKNSLWLAMKGTREGLWDWDLDNHRILFTSTWFETLNDDSPETQAGPSFWFERVHPDDMNILQADLDSHLSGASGILVNQHRIRGGNGDYVPVILRGLAERDASGKARRLVGSISVLRAESTATHLTTHVPGMIDRGELIRRMQSALARCQRKSSYQFALVMLEIERFNALIDRVGAEVASEILTTVAQRLRDGIRPMDSIAQLGNERFCMFVDDITDPSDTIRLSERAQRNIRDLCNVNGQDIHLSASIGIALGNLGYQAPDRLLRDAESAMMRARDSGSKGKLEIYDQATHERAITLLEMESDVRRAIENSEFQVRFQPIIDLSHQRIEGLAARLHWEHPRRGLMAPWEFIAVAETHGLVEPLADQLLTNACRQLAQWRQRLGKRMPSFINFKMASHHLMRPSLIDRLLQALHETDLDATDIRIEVSERALSQAVDESASVMHQLKALDIRLGIGDFGIGAASLLNLQRFPIDFITLDSKIVRLMGPTASQPAVARALLQMGRELKLTINAEGVETTEQATTLASLGCRLACGSLFGAAEPAAKIGDYLDAAERLAQKAVIGL